jgi:CubicO group peptidase (beta-lactamase class C family)
LAAGILPYGGQVTIRQLLNHTSGVPHNWATIEQTLYRSPGGRSTGLHPDPIERRRPGRDGAYER